MKGYLVIAWISLFNLFLDSVLVPDGNSTKELPLTTEVFQRSCKRHACGFLSWLRMN